MMFRLKRRHKMYTRVFRAVNGFWRVQILDHNGDVLFLTSGRGYSTKEAALKRAVQIQESRFSFPPSDDLFIKGQ